MDAKEYENAIEAFRMVSHEHPISPDAFNNIGCALLNLERYDEAVREFDLAIKHNSQHFEAYMNKGLALFELGEIKESVEFNNRAIEIEPNDSHNYINRGTSYRTLNLDQKALYDYETAYDLDPSLPLALGNLITIHKKLENCNEVLRLSKLYIYKHGSRNDLEEIVKDCASLVPDCE